MSYDRLAFVRARLDEDEQAATEAEADSPGPWRVGTDGRIVAADGFTVVHVEDGTPPPLTAAHIARHDPARVLREVEAKRQLLDALARSLADDSDDEEALLAMPYADHPDYRAED